MLASGVAPTTASFTILLKLHTFHPNEVDLAYTVIESMFRCGCTPDHIVYSSLIAAFCRAGRIHEALGFLDWMLEQNSVPTIRDYTCIVHAYCLRSKIDDAKRLIDTMWTVGCPPDTVTYTILIEGLCRVGDFGGVEKVLVESEMNHWRPNVVTYNVYMSWLCRRGEIGEAFRQLEAMQLCGLVPDIVTLNILFDCLCRDSSAWEAWCLLERSFELGWIGLDVFFYNTLMSRLCRFGNYSCVQKLLTDMVKRGVEPDTWTITVVIRSLCRGGDLQRAKSFFANTGFVPDVVAFNTLLNGYYMEEKCREVLLLYQMFRENITPNNFTHAIIIDTLCRNGKFEVAINYFFMSLGDEFFDNNVTRLMRWLIKGLKPSLLIRLLEGISVHGVSLNGHTFNSLIRTFCRKGLCQSDEFYKVSIILDKMLAVR